MSIGGIDSGVNAFSPEEFQKHVIKITVPKPGDPGYGEMPGLPSFGHNGDSYDYYTPSSSFKTYTFGLSGLGETSLEQAARQSYQLRFNSDGTSNFLRPDELIEHLRQNGMSKQLDWNAIEKYHLGAITNPGIDIRNSISPVVDEFASSYAVLKDMIGKSYSGDEYNAQMHQLEQVFGRKTDALAHSFASTVSGFLTNAGGSASDEYGKLHESLKAAISEKTEEYAAFIAENKNYAQVEGTQDAWLADNYRYMGTKLQQAVAQQSGGAQTKASGGSSAQSATAQQVNAAGGSQVKSAVYSYDQLRDIDRFARVGSQIMRDREMDARSFSNEEEIGFVMGLTSLQADYLLNSTDTPAIYRNTLSNFMNESTHDVLEKVESVLRHGREQGYAWSKESFPPLDQQAVLDIVDSMRSSFAKSKDLLTAINTGSMKAKSTFFSKQFDADHIKMARYGYGSSDFWDRYDNPTMGAGGIMHNSITSQIQSKFQDMFGIDLSRALNTLA